MSTVRVQFNSVEKTKLIEYLKDKESSYSHRTKTLEREYGLLMECKEKLPKELGESYFHQLKNQIQNWKINIACLKKESKVFTVFIQGLEKGEVIEGKKTKEILNDLYLVECQGFKKVEKKFEYYPRLKKAKEATLYEFANKIKMFMESEYVQVA